MPAMLCCRSVTASMRGRRRPIFVGLRGPLTPRVFQILLSPYVWAAGLKDVTPLPLRHGSWKNLVNAAGQFRKIAALAGHESLETTRRYCEP
jgi:integrase/recombinase XerD